MKVLVAIDGSDCSQRALEYVISHREIFGATPEITLIHAHHAIPSARAVAWVGKEVVDKYYTEEADAALATAIDALKDAHLPTQTLKPIGDPGHEIAKAASGFQMLVMGTHGRTALKNLLIGGVATRAIAESTVPVLLVK